MARYSSADGLLMAEPQFSAPRMASRPQAAKQREQRRSWSPLRPVSLALALTSAKTRFGGRVGASLTDEFPSSCAFPRGATDVASSARASRLCSLVSLDSSTQSTLSTKKHDTDGEKRGKPATVQ